jgi:hypothetical protein
VATHGLENESVGEGNVHDYIISLLCIVLLRENRNVDGGNCACDRVFGSTDWMHGFTLDPDHADSANFKAKEDGDTYHLERRAGSGNVKVKDLDDDVFSTYPYAPSVERYE